jgi:hypothetical protein
VTPIYLGGPSSQNFLLHPSPTFTAVPASFCAKNSRRKVNTGLHPNAVTPSSAYVIERAMEANLNSGGR